VLQSSEGGFLSVGNRRTPASVTPLEKVSLAMPANMLRERMPPRVRSSRFSTLPAATDKIVISRNVLLGLCLTTFAFGIVTTLAIDHLHARASDIPAPGEPAPVVLQTTPIEPIVRTAPAADAVVVQLPPVAEKVPDRSAQRSGKMLARLPPPTAPRVARPIAAGPVRAGATSAFHRRGSATVQGDPSIHGTEHGTEDGTEAAPDDNSARPTPTKKKWVDPFDQ
jgi:predicted outer membrane lipoprotein